MRGPARVLARTVWKNRSILWPFLVPRRPPYRRGIYPAALSMPLARTDAEPKSGRCSRSQERSGAAIDPGQPDGHDSAPSSRLSDRPHRRGRCRGEGENSQLRRLPEQGDQIHLRSAGGAVAAVPDPRLQGCKSLGLPNGASTGAADRRRGRQSYSRLCRDTVRSGRALADANASPLPASST